MEINKTITTTIVLLVTPLGIAAAATKTSTGLHELGSGHSFIFTSDAPEPGSYNQARVLDLGDYLMVHTAGQTGNDPAVEGQEVVKAPTGETGGIEAQTTQALHNIEAVLKTAGGDRSHIVKTTVFLENMTRDNAGFEAAYRAFFDGVPLPARSKVGVSQIPTPDEPTIVEIEAIAYIPKPKK